MMYIYAAIPAAVGVCSYVVWRCRRRRKWQQALAVAREHTRQRYLQEEEMYYAEESVIDPALLAWIDELDNETPYGVEYEEDYV